MLNLLGFILCIFSILLYKAQATKTDTCEHSCTTKRICKAKLISTNCYYAFTDKHTTWNGNRAFCSSQNMSMVKLSENVTPDIRALQTLAAGFGTESYAWLGGRATFIKKWKFVNGVPLRQTYVSGATLNKDQDNKFKCGILEYSKTTGNRIEYHVNAADCHEKYKFICRFDDWMNTTSTYMSETATNWYDARSRCKQLGGDLFYLKEWKSFDQIADKLKPATANSLFIGLIHRKWQWEDGQDAMLHNLNYGGYYKSRGDCIAMSLREGIWVEADCGENLRTFCRGMPLGENDLMSTVVSQMEQTTEVIIAKEKDAFPGPVVTYIIVATLVTALLISLVGHILRTKCTCRSTKVISPEGSQESLEMADNVYISIEPAENHEEMHTGNPSLPNVVPPAPHEPLRVKIPKQICERNASPSTPSCRCNTGCGNRMSHSTWEISDGSSIQNRALPLTPVENANVMGWKSVEELSPRKCQTETSRPRFQDLTFQSPHGLGQVGPDTARNPCMKCGQKIKRRDGYQEQGQGQSFRDDYLPPRAPAGSKNENLASTKTKGRTHLEFSDNPRSEENTNILKTNDGDEDDEDDDDNEAEDTNTKSINTNEYMGFSPEVLTEAEGEERKRNSSGTLYTLLGGRPGTAVINEGSASADTTRIDDDSSIAMSPDDINSELRFEEN